MLQICDVANKFETLINLVVFVQYLTGNMLKTHFKSLVLVCQNPERLISILWFSNKF